MSPPKYQVKLTVRQVILFLVAAFSVLVLVNLVLIYNRYVVGSQYEIFWVFYFDAEANVPTLFSLFLLLMCAGFFWITTALAPIKTARQATFFKVLTYLFLFLAVDEVAGFHEMLINVTRQLLGNFTANGYLYFAWVVPYSILIILIAVFLVKGYLRLPGRTRLIFFIGVSIFLSGAVLFEMISGQYLVKHPDHSNDVLLRYALLATLEESLEMIGAIVILFGIIKFYLKNSDTKKVEFQACLCQTPASDSVEQRS